MNILHSSEAAHVIENQFSDLSLGQIQMRELARISQETIGQNIFRGMNADPTEKEWMGRLIEFLPSQPEQRHFDAMIAFARLLNLPEAVAIVRKHAYDPSSSHQRMAVEALASIDPAARELTERWKREEINRRREEARSHPVIRGCCQDH